MNDDFFEWLESCPCQWFLAEANSDYRVYEFRDNSKEENEDLDNGE